MLPRGAADLPNQRSTPSRSVLNRICLEIVPTVTSHAIRWIHELAVWTVVLSWRNIPDFTHNPAGRCPVGSKTDGSRTESSRVGVRGQPIICRSSEKRVDILIRDFS